MFGPDVDRGQENCSTRHQPNTCYGQICLLVSTYDTELTGSSSCLEPHPCVYRQYPSPLVVIPKKSGRDPHAREGGPASRAHSIRGPSSRCWPVAGQPAAHSRTRPPCGLPRNSPAPVRWSTRAVGSRSRPSFARGRINFASARMRSALHAHPLAKGIFPAAAPKAFQR